MQIIHKVSCKCSWQEHTSWPLRAPQRPLKSFALKLRLLKFIICSYKWWYLVLFCPGLNYVPAKRSPQLFETNVFNVCKKVFIHNNNDKVVYNVYSKMPMQLWYIRCRCTKSIRFQGVAFHAQSFIFGDLIELPFRLPITLWRQYTGGVVDGADCVSFSGKKSINYGLGSGLIGYHGRA